MKNNLIETIKSNGSNYIVTEEAIFDQIAQEVASNTRKDGLWTKALSESSMDEDSAKALYIKFRAEQIRNEVDQLLSKLKTEEQHSFNQALAEAKKDRELAAEELYKAKQITTELNALKLKNETQNSLIDKKIDEQKIEHKRQIENLNFKLLNLEHTLGSQKSHIEKIEKEGIIKTNAIVLLVISIFAMTYYIIHLKNEKYISEVASERSTSNSHTSQTKK